MCHVDNKPDMLNYAGHNSIWLSITHFAGISVYLAHNAYRVIYTPMMEISMEISKYRAKIQSFRRQ